MSATRQKLPLAVAAPLAAKIIAELRPHCVRVEIAGSIRRRRDEVGDIEVLAVPDVGVDLLGEEDDDTMLDLKIQSLFNEGRLKPGPRNGPQWKTLEIGHWPGVMLDLFIVDGNPPDSWGVQLAIRTGPADLAKALVTERCRGGVLPDGHAVALGWRVWRRDDLMTGMIDGTKYSGPFVAPLDGAKPIPMADERAFIEFCFGRWIEPPARDDWRTHL